MATSAFNLGQNCSVVLIGGATGRLDLQIVTEFQSAQQVKTVHVDPLNAPPLEAHLPGGWTFSFSIDRASSALDDAIASLEQAYWNGATILFGSLYQYINELDGSTSTYQFNNVTFHQSAGGAWTQNQVVKQSLAGWASTRYRI